MFQSVIHRPSNFKIPSEGFERLALVSLVIQLSVLCWWLFFSEHIFLMDLSEWTYQSHILLHKFHNGSLYSHIALKDYPVPNSIVTCVLFVLGLAMPLSMAVKILVAMFVTYGLFLSCRISVRSDKSIDYIMLLLSFSILWLSSCFWNGYLSFVLGLMFLCHALIFIGEAKLKTNQIVLFTILCFFSHAIPASVLILLIFIEILKSKAYKQLLYLLPSIVLFSWYFFARLVIKGNVESMMMHSELSDLGVVAFVQHRVYSWLKTGLFRNFILSNEKSFLESEPLAFWLLMSLNVCVVCSIVVYFFDEIRSYFKDRVHVVVVVMILFVGCLLPPVWNDIVNPTERLFMVVLVILLTRPTGLLHKKRKWLAATLTIAVYVFQLFNAYFLVCTYPVEERLVYQKTFQKDSTKLIYFQNRLFYHGYCWNAIENNLQDTVRFSSGLLLNKH